MLSFFPTAMQWIYGVEGGYADDPHAGPTYAGISLSRVNAWIVANGGHALSFPQFKQLGDRPELMDAYYLAQYWLPMRTYDLLPWQAPALVCFDGAVLQGTPTMIRIFQAVIQTNVDGVLGPLTLARYQQVLLSMGALNLASQLICRRREVLIALHDPVNEKGWLNRLGLLESRCANLPL